MKNPIKEWRETNRLSQVEAAKVLGLNQQRVSFYERNCCIPSPGTVRRLNDRVADLGTKLLLSSYGIAKACVASACASPVAQQELFSAAREAARLRKIFDDAGAGEHDVLALIDYYQEVTLDAEARLEAIRKLLAEENGHECVGEGICLACRIAKACVAPPGGDK